MENNTYRPINLYHDDNMDIIFMDGQSTVIKCDKIISFDMHDLPDLSLFLRTIKLYGVKEIDRAKIVGQLLDLI